MKNDHDERLAREQAQNHPPSMAEVMGEDLGNVFDDGPGPGPGKRSSAARLARRVRLRKQAAAARQDLAVLDQAAMIQAEDEALERATDLIRRGLGHKIPAGTRAPAARAARRQGTSIPTAEQYAAQALSRRQDWKPFDDDRS